MGGAPGRRGPERRRLFGSPAQFCMAVTLVMSIQSPSSIRPTPPRANTGNDEPGAIFQALAALVPLPAGGAAATEGMTATADGMTFRQRQSFPAAAVAFTVAPSLPTMPVAFRRWASVGTRLSAESSSSSASSSPSPSTMSTEGQQQQQQQQQQLDEDEKVEEDAFIPASIRGVGGMDYEDSLSFLAQEMGMSDSQARAIAERIFNYRNQQQQQQQQNTLPPSPASSLVAPASAPSTSHAPNAADVALATSGNASVTTTPHAATAATATNGTPPPAWMPLPGPQLSFADIKESLTMFIDAGFVGGDLTKMIVVCPELVASQTAAQHAVGVARYLMDTYGLRRYDIRRIARSEPALLAVNRSKMIATTEALAEAGLSGKNAVKMALIRWPALLMQPPENVARLSAFLLSDEVGFRDSTELGSLLKLSPWLVAGGTARACGDAKGKYRAVVRCLNEVGGLEGRARDKKAANKAPTPMSVVVRAFPQVFDLDVATELTPRIRFLEVEAGIPRADVQSVIQSFPLVLGLDVTSRMRPVIRLLEEDLDIPPPDVAKICRAFPSLLGLNSEEHFVPAMTFLRSTIGVQNVARFVRRLPPVLGYDVDTILEPKWRYLTEELQLSSYDVTRFPAYFSYPLDSIIIPRTKYLKEKVNRPGSVWGLNLILPPSDAIFAAKVAGTTLEEYKEFKDAVMSNIREEVEKKSEAKQEQQRREQVKRETKKSQSVEVKAADGRPDSDPTLGDRRPSTSW